MILSSRIPNWAMTKSNDYRGLNMFDIYRVSRKRVPHYNSFEELWNKNYVKFWSNWWWWFIVVKKYYLHMWLVSTPNIPFLLSFRFITNNNLASIETHHFRILLRNILTLNPWFSNFIVRFKNDFWCVHSFWCSLKSPHI